MGWIIDTIECPNCKEKKAVVKHRSSYLQELILICNGCGLIAYAPTRDWVVEKSSFNQKFIGIGEDKINKMLDDNLFFEINIPDGSMVIEKLLDIC